MGKTRTLRRAIEREPEQWYSIHCFRGRVGVYYKSAYRTDDGGWSTSRYAHGAMPTYAGAPYYGFVKATLVAIGRPTATELQVALDADAGRRSGGKDRSDTVENAGSIPSSRLSHLDKIARFLRKMKTVAPR